MSMMSLESRLIEAELTALGGIEKLARGQRIFLVLEDWPKSKLQGQAQTKMASKSGLHLRAGDFVQADGNEWITAFQSSDALLVRVLCKGKRGAVPAHVIRWLRMPGEMEDMPPLKEVNPEFAGLQYTTHQVNSALRIQTWGRGVIARQRVARMKKTVLMRQRMHARREAIGKEMAQRPRAEASLHVAGLSFGGLDDGDDTDADDESEQDRPRKRGNGISNRSKIMEAIGENQGRGDSKPMTFLDSVQMKFNILQLGTRLAVVRFLLYRWHPEMMLDTLTAPSDAVYFTDVIKTMAYWENQEQCPASQRKRRRHIEETVRRVKAVLLVKGYVAGWRQRRAKRKAAELRRREEERQRLLEETRRRQEAEENQRREKAEAKQALEDHVSAAVKDLREEAARLRQTARSVSTENDLLMFSLQESQREMKHMQAALRDEKLKAARAQAEANAVMLASKQDLALERFGAGHSHAQLEPAAIDKESSPAAAEASGALGSRDNSSDANADTMPASRGSAWPGEDTADPHNVAYHGPEARVGETRLGYSAKAATTKVESPWKREKMLARDIEHHRQALHRLTMQRTLAQHEQAELHNSATHMRSVSPQRAIAEAMLRQGAAHARFSDTLVESRQLSRSLDLATTASSSESQESQKHRSRANKPKPAVRSNPGWNSLE